MTTHHPFRRAAALTTAFTLVAYGVPLLSSRTASAAPPMPPPDHLFPVSDMPVATSSITSDGIQPDPTGMRPRIDLRYTTEKAGSFARSCIGDVDPANPSSWKTIATCMESVWKWYGDPCVAPSEADCRAVPYHQSWCGRREFAVRGEKKDWTCNVALANLGDDVAARPEFEEHVVLYPEVMTGADGVTTHETERGVAITGEAATMTFTHPTTGETRTSSSYDETYYSETPVPDGPSIPLPPGGWIPIPGGWTPPPPTGPTAPRLSSAEGLKRYRWRDNGAAITSCEEYAYERFNDFGLLEDYARTKRRNPREIYRAVTEGWPGHDALVDDAGNLHMVDTVGRSLPMPRRTAPFYGDEIYPGGFRHPSSELPAGPPGFPDVEGTYARLAMANTAKYLVWAGGGAYGAPMPLDYYVPVHDSLSWAANLEQHRLAADRMADAGFLDEELERAAALQREAWNLAVRIQEVERERSALTASHPRYATLWDQEVALRADLDEALARAETWGCADTGATPCDWAPSMFAEPLFRWFSAQRDDAREACIAKYGPGLLSSEELEERYFFDASRLFAPDSHDQRVASAIRGLYMINDYLSGPDAFERLEADARAYAEQIYLLLGLEEDEADGVFRASSEFRHSVGKEGMFGLTFSTTGQLGLVSRSFGDDASPPPGTPLPPGPPVPMPEPEPSDVCSMGPFYEGDVAARVELFGLDINMIELAEALDRGELPTTEPGTTRRGGWGASLNAALKGEALYRVPCTTDDGVPTNCTGDVVSAEFSVGYGLSYEITTLIQAGPVTISLGAGIGGAVRAFVGVSASSLTVDESPDGATDCVDPLRHETTVSFGPAFSLSGFLSAGAGLGPLQVGIKGTILIVDVALPNTYRETFSTDTAVRRTGFAKDLVLTTLSGSIALFIAIKAGPIVINLLEFVIVEFAGPVFRVRLMAHDAAVDEKVQNVCWISELRFITERADELDGCTCVLNPDCD